jgi:hypothetical protein
MDSKPTPPDTQKEQPPMTTESAPAGPVTVEPPEHPLHALTTYGLSRYRRQLEHALKTLPEHAAVRELLREKLAEVLTEQESRAVIAHAPAR